MRRAPWNTEEGRSFHFGVRSGILKGVLCVSAGLKFEYLRPEEEKWLKEE